MRDIITTTKAPAAIGPYSQGIKVNDNFVFTSGQIPMDPATGEIVGTTTGEQTKQVLENLSSVLKAGGSSLEHVIKMTVFLKNMDDFSAMNEVYGSYFPENPPARSAVEVVRLPKDVLVEMECIALVVK